MRIFLSTLVLIITLAACQKDTSREVVSATSPDGHSFHFMPIYEDGVTDITIAIAWPMTWAFDSDTNPAVPYVAAQTILNGGTELLTPQEVLELFNDKNAGGNLSVRSDHAIGEVSFPKEHIDDVIDIVSQMLVNPQISYDWVERIKQGITANQAQAATQSVTQMWAAARYAVLGDQPLYSFLTLDDLSRIEEVTEVDIHRWHRETIVQSNVTIAVTGAISRDDAGKAVDGLLSGLPAGENNLTSRAEVDFQPREILLHLPDAEKTTLGLIGQLPPTSEGGDLTDLLALQVFGRSGNGPLFDAIRTQLRASYGFQAGYTNYDRATRIMFITGEVETTKLSEAKDLVLETYETFRTRGEFVGLEDTRDAIADGTRQNIKYVDVAARTILEFALDAEDPTNTPRLGDLVAGISKEVVVNRLQDVFPSRSELIVVATSPNPNAMPGACVVTQIEQVALCQ